MCVPNFHTFFYLTGLVDIFI